jgi:hypothetical protein
MSTVLEQLSSVPIVTLETSTPGTSAKECVLLTIGCNELHLRASGFLAPATRVKVHFEHVEINGEVLYSRLKEDAWITCIGFESDEQGRVDPRFPVDLPASVTALSETGSVRAEARITDMCRAGLGLTVAESVRAGSMVCVETGAILVIGSVRYCHRQPGKDLFRIGMEITDILHGTQKLRGFSSRMGSLRRKLAQVILGRPLHPGFDIP